MAWKTSPPSTKTLNVCVYRVIRTPRHVRCGQHAVEERPFQRRVKAANYEGF